MTTLDTNVEQKVQQWLNGSYDQETKSEIQTLLDSQNYSELTDAFYKDLEFGTGGLRGIMGVGTNRMNKYTVGKATQGLCNYLKHSFPGEQIKFAIAYDNRNNSDAFAHIVADICSANGFVVYFFEALRPTPELSFAIRHLGCHSGVMLTASHNPREYNGYKAYWSDGGQVVAPHDTNIITHVNMIQDLEQIHFRPIPENIHILGKEIDEIYLNEIIKFRLDEAAVRKQHDLKIVFSSIHGTGITIVPSALEKWGFTNVSIVEEQAIPDGNFPTVIYPNPEEAEALKLSLALGKELTADLIMATDPDADRVGIAIPDLQGNFQLLNGNQTLSLLIDYVLRRHVANNSLPHNPLVVKTIVTTGLITEIAARYGVELMETLTGFKYIGSLMTKFLGEKQFLVGGEESYGYLIGDLVRDKDAVISCSIIAEMTAHYKSGGKSLFEALLDLYMTYGFYREKLVSITKKGKEGADEIKEMMHGLRTAPPVTLGGSRVVIIRDYQQSTEKNLNEGTSNPIDLPRSNVLQFITEDGTIISARPSGTEPKIKFYCSVKGHLANHAAYDEAAAELDKKLEGIMNELQ